ncbi:sulP [Ectocarpus sp. CCAP 1310/34]|nr:sulP [Ectocarpus sp. CCAP 1310/34]
MITFMVSMWYFLMAIFNLGEPLAMLLADPVISGFVTASALLVANSQLWEVRDTINWWSVTMGVGSMLVYFALRRGNAYIKSRGVAGFFVPEALTVVILSTFVSWAFDLEGTQDVAIVGTIPPGLPAPKFPRLDKLTTFAQVEDMAGVALVAALVSFIITHSIAKSLAGAQEIKATPQLLAFGVANLAGSIFSALPGSASLSRAAIIDALGARTIIHNVFTFVLMTLVLLFLSPLLKFLPTSVLAATIYAVIYKFFHFDEPFKLYRVGVSDTVMWLATFAATMLLSVRDGIVVGMAVSAFTLIQRSSSPLVMHMGLLPGTTLYRDMKTYPDAQRQPGVEVIRFGASLTFANKDVFRRAVIKVVEKADAERRVAESQGKPAKVALQYVILDSSSIHDLDSSSLKTLEGLVALLVDRDPPIEMFLAPVSDPLMVQESFRVVRELSPKQPFLARLVLSFTVDAVATPGDGAAVYAVCFRRCHGRSRLVSVVYARSTESFVRYSSASQHSQPGTGKKRGGWWSHGVKRKLKKTAIGASSKIYRDDFHPKLFFLFFKECCSKCQCTPGFILRKSPLLCATLGRRYFLSTATAVTYALQQVAAGQLVASASLYHKVMSSISLGNLDEGDLGDI